MTVVANITARSLLRKMFDAAVASAQPDKVIAQYLPEKPAGRIIVIGFGKAAAAMARAVEDHWQVELEGLVVTRYGYAVPCRHIEVIEAAHPVPDAAGLQAARRIKALVSNLTADDLVLCLISGGGSALLVEPLAGITLEDKQNIGKQLLSSGASISEINCVRRHLSAIKGGRLAAACHPAAVVSLIISDVPGDKLPDIASGPTVADATTSADALDIIDHYKIKIPDKIRQLLNSKQSESIKPDDARLTRVENHIISSPQIGLEAAAEIAKEAGYRVLILGDSIEGEAREVGKVMAGIARQVTVHDQPLQAPCVILSGGETTVTVRGKGRGGRNVEFLLAMALSLDGLADVYGLAGDTDGVDGQEEIAGAVVTPDTLTRANALAISARQSLDNNDGHGFFEALEDCVMTGPTLTNINDFRALLINRKTEQCASQQHANNKH